MIWEKLYRIRLHPLIGGILVGTGLLSIGWGLLHVYLGIMEVDAWLAIYTIIGGQCWVITHTDFANPTSPYAILAVGGVIGFGATGFAMLQRWIPHPWGHLPLWTSAGLALWAAGKLSGESEILEDEEPDPALEVAFGFMESLPPSTDVRISYFPGGGEDEV